MKLLRGIEKFMCMLLCVGTAMVVVPIGLVIVLFAVLGTAVTLATLIAGMTLCFPAGVWSISISERQRHASKRLNHPQETEDPSDQTPGVAYPKENRRRQQTSK